VLEVFTKRRTLLFLWSIHLLTNQASGMKADTIQLLLYSYFCVDHMQAPNCNKLQ